MTAFLYVLYGFAGAGFICLILACTPWEPGTPPEHRDLVIGRMNCGGCRVEPCAPCDCPEDCGHQFCRWAPPLTGLTREDHAFLDGDRSMP